MPRILSWGSAAKGHSKQQAVPAPPLAQGEPTSFWTPWLLADSLVGCSPQLGCRAAAFPGLLLGQEDGVLPPSPVLLLGQEDGVLPPSPVSSGEEDGVLPPSPVSSWAKRMVCCRLPRSPLG